MKVKIRLSDRINKLVLLNDAVCAVVLDEASDLRLICTRTLDIKGELSDPQGDSFGHSCCDLLLLADEDGDGGGRLVCLWEDHGLTVWSRQGDNDWWRSALD